MGFLGLTGFGGGATGLAQAGGETAKATGGAISFYGGNTIHTFINSGSFQTPGTFSETCEYVVVGGGGGGYTGGGGAGGYRTGTTPIGSSVNYAVTIGGGAISGPGSTMGSSSEIGTIPISIPGGGNGGGAWTSPVYTASPGASGAGGAQGGGGMPGASGTGSPYPGSVGPTPTSGWGHAGATSQPADKTGGGGGGAGSAGNGNSQGGTGVQLPTTFRNPAGFKYDNFPDHPYRPSATAGWFVSGGGGGTVYTSGGTPYSASHPGMGGVGGGGSRNPADPRHATYGYGGMANTGGGGGGGSPLATSVSGSTGGSGLVLIAYPT